jgi:hypothetical protein
MFVDSPYSELTDYDRARIDNHTDRFIEDAESRPRELMQESAFPVTRIRRIMRHECLMVPTEEPHHPLLPLASSSSSSSSSASVSNPTAACSFIATEVPFLMGHLVDLFLFELSTRAWAHANKEHRRTIQENDLVNAVFQSHVFDFLIDLVPKESIPTYRRVNRPRPGVSRNTGLPHSASGSASLTTAEVPLTDSSPENVSDLLTFVPPGSSNAGMKVQMSLSELLAPEALLQQFTLPQIDFPFPFDPEVPQPQSQSQTSSLSAPAPVVAFPNHIQLQVPRPVFPTTATALSSSHSALVHSSHDDDGMAAVHPSSHPMVSSSALDQEDVDMHGHAEPQFH